MTDVDATGNGGRGETIEGLEELKWDKDEVDGREEKFENVGVLKADAGVVKRAFETWPGEGILVDKGKLGGGKARHCWGRVIEEEGTTFPTVAVTSRDAAARSSTREDSIDWITSSCERVLVSALLILFSRTSSLASRLLDEWYLVEEAFSITFLAVEWRDLSSFLDLVPDDFGGGGLAALPSLELPGGAREGSGFILSE